MDKAEKVARAIRKHVRTEIGQDWDGMTYTLTGVEEAAQEIAALDGGEAVPVAWQARLNDAVMGAGEWQGVSKERADALRSVDGIEVRDLFAHPPRSEVERAVKEERERCAKIVSAEAGKYLPGGPFDVKGFCRGLAAAIRSTP